MMDDSVHILLIEDDPAHSELIQRAFENRGDASRLSVAQTLAEARDHIKNSNPTLIIADWRLPDGDSRELLSEEHNSSNPPVIIMTSYGSERNAVEAIKSGALDYIVKSSESMTDMPHIAERAIGQWKILLEQERMQKALAESEAQFRLLAENSSDMITRHDTNLNILYASPACRVILGYEPEELKLIGQPVFSLIHPTDAKYLLDLLSSSKWDDTTPALPYRAHHKNGEYIWLETTARIIHDQNQNVVEYQASTRNISERREAQTALQHALNNLQDAYDKTIEGWVIALDLRDKKLKDTQSA